MGWAADRFRRIPIIGWSSVIFAGMVTLSGLAVNAFAFFWTRFGVGIAKANTIPVHSSVIADTYPIGIRGRIGAIEKGSGRVLAVLSPVVVGGIIPEEDAHKLREAGVRRVYTPKDFDLTRIMGEIVDVVAEARAAA